MAVPEHQTDRLRGWPGIESGQAAALEEGWGSSDKRGLGGGGEENNPPSSCFQGVSF